MPFFPANHKTDVECVKQFYPFFVAISPVKDMQHIPSPRSSCCKKELLLLLPLRGGSFSFARPPAHRCHLRQSFHSQHDQRAPLHPKDTDRFASWHIPVPFAWFFQ